MQSLATIMQKLTLTPRRNTGSDRELIQALIQQEHPYPPCNQCDDIGWLIHDVPVGHADHGKAYPCECRINQNPEHQQLQLQNQSNLQHLLEVTFERTNPNGLDPNTVAQDKFRTAFQKAKAFAEEPRNWIAITGPSGSGKTQLAAAAANQCLNSNKQVYYAQTSEILNQIRSNIRDNPNQATSTLEQAKKADLLVLDDLRSDGASPWAADLLLQLLNHRFNGKQPTILVIQGNPQDLDPRILSRINPPTGIAQLLDLGNPTTLRSTPAHLSMLPVKYRNMNFENFVTQKKSWSANVTSQMAEAKARAAEYAAKPSNFLMLTGERGCGKTHLAVAIANQVLQNGGSYIYTMVPDLMDYLRTTYGPTSPATFDQVFEGIKNEYLVILDDLLTERGTVWVEEKLYQLFIHRYNNEMPTIITSTFRVEEFAKFRPRIHSRLIDHDSVTTINLPVPNYFNQVATAGPNQPQR